MEEKNDPKREDKKKILEHIRSERWERALTKMMRTFQNEVYRYCYRRLGAEDAKDVVQEVFLAAWKALPKIRLEHGQNSIAPWLFAIAKYKVIDALVVASRERVVAGREEEGSDVGIETRDSMADRVDSQRRLMRLDENDRKVLILDALGFSAREIVCLLDEDITPEGVRTRIFRARKKL